MYIIESIENTSPEDEYTKEINSIIENILPNRYLDVELNEDIKSLTDTIWSYISYNTINRIVYINPKDLDKQKNDNINSIMEKIPYLKNIQKIWNIARKHPINFKIEEINPNSNILFAIQGTPGIEESIKILKDNTKNKKKPNYIKISIVSINEMYTPPIWLSDEEYKTLLQIVHPNTQPTFHFNQTFDIPTNTHNQIIQVFNEKYSATSISINTFIDKITKQGHTHFISKYKYFKE